VDSMATPTAAQRCTEVQGGTRRLTRDPEQQKYSEVVALVSVTVGREQFRNVELRFYTAWTLSGPHSGSGPIASALVANDWTVELTGLITSRSQRKLAPGPAGNGAALGPRAAPQFR
jgi:hypothetical protein